MEIESENPANQTEGTLTFSEAVDDINEGKEQLKEQLKSWQAVIDKNMALTNEIEYQKEKLMKEAQRIKSSVLNGGLSDGEGSSEESEEDANDNDPLNTGQSKKKRKDSKNDGERGGTMIRKDEPDYMKTLGQISDMMMDIGIDLRKISSFTEPNRSRFSMGFDTFLQEERPLPPPTKLKIQPESAKDNAKNLSAKFQNGSKARRKFDDKGSAYPSLFSMNTGIGELNSKALEQLNQKNPSIEYFVDTFKMAPFSESDVILKKHNMEIKGHDLIKLHPEVYLNDTIINFFLKFLQNEVLSEDMVKRTYIFNTYFIGQIREKIFAIEDWVHDSENYEKLVQTTEEDFKMIHKKFSKWVKNDSLEHKDFIIFPMNFTEHWSCLIALYPRNVRESAMVDESQKPRFIYFDSLGLFSPYYADIIRGQEFNADFNQDNFPHYQLIAPKQSNFYDCGLYMIQYIEMFLRNPEEVLKDTRNGRDIVKWFPKKLINSKRASITNLILQMAAEDPNYLKNYTDELNSILSEKHSDDSGEYDIPNEADVKAYIESRDPKAGEVSSNEYLQLRMEFFYSLTFFFKVVPNLI